jgi:hypothetical protein
MVKVKVNGNDHYASNCEANTLADLIEVVQASIDPDTIMTEILLDGKNLEQIEWRQSVNSNSGRVLEIRTGTRDDYVRGRLNNAPEVLNQITVEFVNAKKSFDAGIPSEASTELARAVRDLQAFVEWYNAILSVEPNKYLDARNKFNNCIEDISQVCETLVQQQMYQAWWAIGDTLGERLGPQLESLRELCVSQVDA